MTSWENGMIVFVHNSSFSPTLADGVHVDLGKLTSITVRRTFTRNYPYPYSQCKDLTQYSSYLYDFILSSNQTYRQIDCFNLCLQQKVISTCECYSLEYSSLNTFAEPCLNLTQYNCIDNQKNSFDSDACQERSCPLECNSVRFDLGLSSITNPGLKEFQSFNQHDLDFYENLLGNSTSLTYDAFKSMWVNVWIYYPSLEYTLITETPKTSMIDLFTQIGGSLGLFVSFSLFTLFELIEIICLVVYALLFK